MPKLLMISLSSQSKKHGYYFAERSLWYSSGTTRPMIPIISEISAATRVKVKAIFSILAHWRKNSFKVISLVPQRKRRPILNWIWTSALYIQRFQKWSPILPSPRKYRVPKVSKRILTRVYHQNGVKYRRASYCYNKIFTMEIELSDWQQIVAAQMTRDMIMKERLIYIDEPTFNLWTTSNYLWMGRVENFQCRSAEGKASPALLELRMYKVWCTTISSLVQQKGITKGKLFMDNLCIQQSKVAQESSGGTPRYNRCSFPLTPPP